MQVSLHPHHLQVGVEDEEFGKAGGEDPVLEGQGVEQVKGVVKGGPHRHAGRVDDLEVHREVVAKVLLLALLLGHKEPVERSPGAVG